MVEDSGSVAINLCLVSESGTLTFPVEVTVSSAAISATGIWYIIRACIYIQNAMMVVQPSYNYTHVYTMSFKYSHC